MMVQHKQHDSKPIAFFKPIPVKKTQKIYKFSFIGSQISQLFSAIEKATVGRGPTQLLDKTSCLVSPIPP